MRSRRPPLLARLGKPRVALLIGDAAVIGWLIFAYARFTTSASPAPTPWIIATALGALAAYVSGLHRTLGALKLFVGAILLAGIVLVVALPGTSLGSASWFGLCGVVLLTLFRLSHGTLAAAAPVGEMLRLVALGAMATMVFLPFYQAASIGSGDAYWYSIMLADVAKQFEAGVFPVWVGQSAYAFNGTVYPLRLAPAFQYAGGLVDTLTAHTLGPAALKNLLVALWALLGTYSAYGFIRPIISGRPNLAAVLATLWILSPGVLAPVMSGDQYMTFMTLPFVPMVFHGLWRVWAIDDGWSRVWLALGLAGAMLSHAPIALWLILLAGGGYLAAMLKRRQWLREVKLLALLGALFLLAGSLPLLSALTLDNQVKIPSSGSSVPPEIRAVFPDNFQPIDLTANGLSRYQLGYTIIGLFVMAAISRLRVRAAGGWPLLLAAVAVTPFTVPVPVLTDLIWLRLMPNWFITVNNVWPMQRLFLIWSALIVFGFVAIWRAPRLLESRAWNLLLAGSLVVGLAWSGREAGKLADALRRTNPGLATTRLMESPENLVLTRYSYASFADIPTYASHSYMEPWLENRLLDPESLQVLVANDEAAAPPIDLERRGAGHPRLLEHGILQAASDNESEFHNLSPAPAFEPGQRYALRIHPLVPVERGHLQISGSSLFREYSLPDAGTGFRHAGPPRAFGTLPSSSKVVPLIFPGPERPKLDLFRVIMPRRDETEFPFAEYWLYTYEREDLPVVVDSWIPYRARTEVALPAYLETPRLWLKHWRATNHGRPVETRRSPNNLVMVPLDPGPNVIELHYKPSLLLRLSFWLSFLTWTGFVLYGLVRLAKANQRPAGVSANVRQVGQFD